MASLVICLSLAIFNPLVSAFNSTNVDDVSSKQTQEALLKEADRLATIAKKKAAAEAKAKAIAKAKAKKKAAAQEAARRAEKERQAQLATQAAETPRTTPKSTNSGYSGSLHDWLYKLRMCESGGDYSINTGNGFYGAYQFTISTWNSWHTGYSRADLAPASVQDATIIKNTNASPDGLASQNPGCYHSTGISAFPPS